MSYEVKDKDFKKLAEILVGNNVKAVDTYIGPATLVLNGDKWNDSYTLNLSISNKVEEVDEEVLVEHENHYEDAKGNKWDKQVTEGNTVTGYTKESALKCSKSLVNCERCVNCNSCHDCKDCDNCTHCEDCFHCIQCEQCTLCTKCYLCQRCEHCNLCISLEHCTRCHDCISSTNCDKCKWCISMDKCISCKSCSNCSHCKDGYYTCNKK